LNRSSPDAVEAWNTRIKNVRKRLASLGRANQNPRNMVLTARERRFFDALYEILPQGPSAKAIADRILAKLR
jgi:hypothetical protein